MKEIKEGIYFSGVGIASLNVEYVGDTIYLRVYLTQMSEGDNIQMYQTFKEGSIEFNTTFLQLRGMMLNPGGSGIVCVYNEFESKFEFLHI